MNKKAILMATAIALPLPALAQENIDLTIAFHRHFVEAGHNDVLLELNDRLADRQRSVLFAAGERLLAHPRDGHPPAAGKRQRQEQGEDRTPPSPPARPWRAAVDAQPRQGGGCGRFAGGRCGVHPQGEFLPGAETLRSVIRGISPGQWKRTGTPDAPAPRLV